MSTKLQSCSESDAEQLESLALIEVPHTDTECLCKLCFRPAQPPGNGLKLGPLYRYGSCQAHLYCLMFSSGLEQKGKEEECIKGFLEEDVIKEWRRGSYLKCSFCKLKYATVGCSLKGCKMSYHLPCGMEEGSLQQFFGNFSSYCAAHKPVQRPLLTKSETSSKDQCGVCLEQVEEEPGDAELWTPCCGGWFHRTCVERMAETAGCHFFKCPLCNNREEFCEEMQQFGIYLPDQDAEWEAGSTYDDQLERHGRCDAEVCLCPLGELFDEDETDWEIVLCSYCGAQGIHIKCGNLLLSLPKWKCSFCTEAVASMPSKSVLVRVKNCFSNSNEFSRNILDNLKFKVSSDEVTVDISKNEFEHDATSVASFLVTTVSRVDIRDPVKVSKDDSEVQLDVLPSKSSPMISKGFQDTMQVLNEEPTKPSSSLVKRLSASSEPLLEPARKKRKLSVQRQTSLLNYFINPKLEHPITSKSGEIQSTSVDSCAEAACHICKENVLPGDDYRCHLNIAHDVQEEQDEQLNLVSCYLCDDQVVVGDDYIVHLNLFHGVLEESVTTVAPEKSVRNQYQNSGKNKEEKDDGEVHGSAVYQCDVCEDTFHNKKTVEVHIHSVHLDLVEELKVEATDLYVAFGIDLANESNEIVDKLEFDDNIVRHLLVPQTKEVKKFQCPFCPKTFIQKGNLNVHIQDLHSGVQEAKKCPNCGKVYNTPGSLRAHMSKKHKKI